MENMGEERIPKRIRRWIEATEEVTKTLLSIINYWTMVLDRKPVVRGGMDADSIPDGQRIFHQYIGSVPTYHHEKFE